MTEYNYRGNYHSKIIEVDDTDYLVQGRIDDKLTMFRPVNDLLECERDTVQVMMGEEVLEE